MNRSLVCVAAELGSWRADWLSSIITSTYDWIEEADILTKIETLRWCDDLKPRDGGETNVWSRVVAQQYNVVKRDDVHQGTQHPKVLRMLLALARAKTHIVGRVVESGTSAWRSFILRWMSARWCGHRLGCEWRASCGFWTGRSMELGWPAGVSGTCCWGVDGCTAWNSVPLSRTRIVIHREALTPSCTGTTSSLLRKTQMDHFEQVLEHLMGIKRVGRFGPGRPSTGKVLKRVVNWSGDGSTWEADPKLTEKSCSTCWTWGKEKERRPWRQGHRERWSWRWFWVWVLRCQACAGRCGTRTVHCSRPSRHCLQRQDSVTADVEAYEAHAASSGASRSLLEEQSETYLEVPVSTAAEEQRRGSCLVLREIANRVWIQRAERAGTVHGWVWVLRNHEGLSAQLTQSQHPERIRGEGWIERFPAWLHCGSVRWQPAGQEARDRWSWKWMVGRNSFRRHSSQRVWSRNVVGEELNRYVSHSSCNTGTLLQVADGKSGWTGWRIFGRWWNGHEYLDLVSLAAATRLNTLQGVRRWCFVVWGWDVHLWGVRKGWRPASVGQASNDRWRVHLRIRHCITCGPRADGHSRHWNVLDLSSYVFSCRCASGRFAPHRGGVWAIKCVMSVWGTFLCCCHLVRHLYIFFGASSCTHVKPGGWETGSVSEWKRVVSHLHVSGHLCSFSTRLRAFVLFRLVGLIHGGTRST